MQTRSSTEIFRYWQALRREGQVPSRTDIDPGAIRHSLADLFILERDGATSPRFRLAGTRICSLFVRELRGARFDSVWSSVAFDRVSEIAHRVMTEATPAVLLANSTNSYGDQLDVEITMLPLQSREGFVDRIFGSLTPITRPTWIGAQALPFLTLDRVSYPDAALRPSDIPVHTAVSRSFSPVAQAHPLRQALRRVMHLSVMEGGKDH